MSEVLVKLEHLAFHLGELTPATRFLVVLRFSFGSFLQAIWIPLGVALDKDGIHLLSPLLIE